MRYVRLHILIIWYLKHGRSKRQPRLTGLRNLVAIAAFLHFRESPARAARRQADRTKRWTALREGGPMAAFQPFRRADNESRAGSRSEEHTSELQSLRHLGCRL